MAVCGGNCMGFANLERRVRALGFYEPKDAPVGGITFLSHSGSAFSAMIHNDRLLGLNLAVSAGQEFVTTVADYLHYALSLESTTAVGLFIETIRDPEGFRSALELAASRDVPIVALKVGRETFTRELVAAHSGALAGEDGAYEALFDAYGVSRVESLDEMADTLALFDAGRRAGPGGLASVHDSGGERALLVDAAAAVGVPFAKISPATTDRLAGLLDPGLPAGEPARLLGDREGRARDRDRLRPGAARGRGRRGARVQRRPHDRGARRARLRGDGEGDVPRDRQAVRDALELRGRHRPDDAKVLHDDGIAVLEGTLTGLAAFKHLFAYRDHRALAPVAGSSPVDGDASRSVGRPACRAERTSTSSMGSNCSPPTASRSRGPNARQTRRGGARRGGADRLPGRAEDGRAEHPTQVGRRRCEARAGRRIGRRRSRVRGPRRAARSEGRWSRRWLRPASRCTSGSCATCSSDRWCSSPRAGSSSRCFETGRLALPPLDEGSGAARSSTA